MNGKVKKRKDLIMKKMVIMLIAAVFFAWSAPANAEEGPFEKLGVACGEELETLCPEVSVGQGRILACLEENKDKLSEACNQAKESAQKQFEELNAVGGSGPAQ